MSTAKRSHADAAGYTHPANAHGTLRAAIVGHGR